MQHNNNNNNNSKPEFEIEEGTSNSNSNGSNSFFFKRRLRSKDKPLSEAGCVARIPPLLPLPVSSEQILATFILARPADCDTGWILIVNAAVYQSRIDSRPLSPESPGVIHDEIRIESFFAVIDIHANGAKGYHTPYLENFFLSLSVSLSPIFMRVTCYAWKEGRRRGSDFSNTFPPGSETIRHGIFDATFSSTSPSSSSNCKFYSCFREEY